MPETSIIVDSGATVTRWLIKIGNNKILRHEGPGLNPNYIPEDSWKELIDLHILQPLSNHFKSWEVTELYFYCAGCWSADRQASVSQALQNIFPRARVTVHHDLLAAARALAGNKPAIIAILGTGSNSGIYDGKIILKKHGGTGYILNDEGGATDIGKKLINAWLNEDMPQEIKNQFERFLGMNPREVIYKVYQQPQHSAVFLGNTCKFAIDNYINSQYLQSLIQSSIQTLITNHLIPLKNMLSTLGLPQDLPVHALGGIVYRISGLWKQELQKHGFKPGKIARDALPGLASYHWNIKYEQEQ